MNKYIIKNGKLQKVRGSEIQDKFEEFTLNVLSLDKMLSLEIFSGFYDKACDLLGFDFNDFAGSRRKIRYRLNIMIEKGMIESRRCGTGFLGRHDSLATYNNYYAMPGFWLTKGNS